MANALRVCGRLRRGRLSAAHMAKDGGTRTKTTHATSKSVREISHELAVGISGQDATGACIAWESGIERGRYEQVCPIGPHLR